MDAALKEYYSDQVLSWALYKEEPFFAKLKKKADVGGRNYPQPIVFGNSAGVSSDFPTAQANIRSADIEQFTMTLTDMYSVWRVAGRAEASTEGDKTAFMDAMTLQSDAALNAIKRVFCSSLFRDGSGSIGQISAASNVATATITLASIPDITNFEVGMRLSAASAVAGAIRTGNGVLNSVLITGIDRTLGTLTIVGNWNASIPAPDAVAASDFLFVQGNARNGGARRVPSGLADWLPLVAPVAGDAFYGVDRSADTTRLAGVRSNQVGVPIIQAMTNGLSAVRREGMGRPDFVFMNYERYRNLINALGTNVRYTEFKNGTIGFEGTKVIYPGGSAEVYPEYNCQDDRAFALQMNTWKLISSRPVPHMDKMDGNSVLRVQTADAVEGRFKAYANLVCSLPGANGVIQLA